ncbi:gastrula zinc finger protein XlCGF49.1-like isoform X2 [Dermacentor albipictus]|uniref:gastrula zinc finger protein XlCGF49.1-like isoform X2 n=1 Tax=Dermacentor albipictus TaxID=60249 RepID=UPI0038FD1B8C
MLQQHLVAPGEGQHRHDGVHTTSGNGCIPPQYRVQISTHSARKYMVTRIRCSGSKHSSSPTTTKNDKLQQRRLHRCDFCAYETRREFNLKTHIRVHTGKKPFQCPSCFLRFSQKGTFTRHQRIHAGEKPFQCPLCPLSFSQKGTLARHQLTHTGERPYQCTICSKSYGRADYLKVHMKAQHHGSPKIKAFLLSNNYQE